MNEWRERKRETHHVVCLAIAQLGFVSRTDTCSLMRAGGPGSIPGADKLYSGFHPSGVGKMWSNEVG